MLIKAVIDKDNKIIHIQQTDKYTYCDTSICTFPVKMNTDWFQCEDGAHATFNQFDVCLACYEKLKKNNPMEF